MRAVQILRRIYARDFSFCKTKILTRFLSSSTNIEAWTDHFNSPTPEFDWQYLCDDANLKEIEQNIMDRKGIGDIYKVRSLWKSYQRETNVSLKESLLQQLNTAASELPNRTSPSSPIGSEEFAECKGLYGTKRDFTFKPQSVTEIGQRLNLLRISDVGHTTGPRTYYFLSDFAKLEQALIRYTLDNLLPRGFTLVTVPDILSASVIEACGFKTTGDRNQVYKLDSYNHSNLCLAGTSEMSLAGLFMNEMCTNLPKKVCAVSHCFRAEVSSTEEEQGIYRVHQFTKVEMFSVAQRGQGDYLLQEFLEIEKQLFLNLGLHFRVLEMPTHELGAPAYRKFDIETWIPSKQFWGEISSASNCTDYQSRRLNIKYQEVGKEDTLHVETVNGTACAVPRLMMAIVENYQQEDGSVAVPEALKQYMSGQTHLQRAPVKGKMKFVQGKHSR
ncbi:serine--tRNA ligase, mitochondrial-like [Ostrea edulis]|uniref:serine--tRNA ligase, mitochondrial-like n=1 Tax=Ostrea edulis TaxID=37623 RepID=UPI00209640FC|nr:serine--tRNA ligase, mitochondrial-like [Ostrea edulis]